MTGPRAWLLATLSCVAGCSTTIVDTSGAGPAQTDYVHGAVYELLHDRYLDSPQGSPKEGRPLQIVATPLSYEYGQAPRSPDEYRNDPARWPKIIGVLPAGTLIRFDRIEQHRYPGLENWWEAYGVVWSGSYTGREVNLGWISRTLPSQRIQQVNPEELLRTE